MRWSSAAQKAPGPHACGPALRVPGSIMPGSIMKWLHDDVAACVASTAPAVKPLHPQATPLGRPPAEFEKLGGREKTKKWKQSIRVFVEGGAQQGKSLGEWLDEHVSGELPWGITYYMLCVEGCCGAASSGSGARGQ